MMNYFFGVGIVLSNKINNFTIIGSFICFKYLDVNSISTTYCKTFIFFFVVPKSRKKT